MSSESRFMSVAGRLLAALTVATALTAAASAETLLRIGDQKGNARAVLEAAKALVGVPYKIQWVEFPAAAPLLEAAKAGAIDAGTVGDAPFTFAREDQERLVVRPVHHGRAAGIRRID